MAKELILTGAKAINLLKHRTFPSENIFSAKFYDGNDEGREDEIIRFSDGFILPNDNVTHLKNYGQMTSRLSFQRKLQSYSNSLSNLPPRQN